MLDAAYSELITNIIINVPTKPISAVYHEKYLNDGLEKKYKFRIEKITIKNNINIKCK